MLLYSTLYNEDNYVFLTKEIPVETPFFQTKLDRIMFTSACTLLAITLPIAGVLYANDKIYQFDCTAKDPKIIQDLCKIEKPKPVSRPKAKKKSNGIFINRAIRVHPSAVKEGESWCMHKGGLSYIEVDTLNNNQAGAWRYICKGVLGEKTRYYCRDKRVNKTT